jgi:polyhydroxybutyrate depolymerase
LTTKDGDVTAIRLHPPVGLRAPATAVMTIALTLVAGCSRHAGAAPEPLAQLEFGGLTRTYIVHLPTGVEHPLALVLNLHGHGGTARGQEALTHYDAVADADGFAVVYPEGIDRSWADGRGTSEADQRGIDDVGFLSTLAAKLVRDYGIDPGHVFATGFSNGAMMTQRLACEHADVFAAVAPVAGTLGTNVACAPSRPVAVVEIHGTADQIVPFGGGIVHGPGGPATVVGAEAMSERWRLVDDCQGDPIQDVLPGNATEVQRFTASRCADRTAVVLMQVDGGGHRWPGGRRSSPTAAEGRTRQSFDAAEVTWHFFADHMR